MMSSRALFDGDSLRSLRAGGDILLAVLFPKFWRFVCFRSLPTVAIYVGRPRVRGSRISTDGIATGLEDSRLLVSFRDASE